MPPAGGMNFAVIAQQVERILGKDEVPGSNPGNSSTRFAPETIRFRCFFFTFLNIFLIFPFFGMILFLEK